MFESLSERFAGAFASLRGRGRVSESEIDAICEEIHRALLDADVALRVVDSFVARIKERALTALPEIRKSTNQSAEIFKIVNEELITILGGAARRIRFAKKPPTVIMLAGLQGSGKTTFADKLARFLASQGNTPLLVAADLQRPNAVTQLGVLAESIGIPIHGPEPGNGIGDPIKVARSGLQFARDKQYNVVIVDTAGRLGIDATLIKEASDIKAAISPDEVLFVVDAMMGQDAIRTAEAFQSGVGFDAVALTKLDGDAKGGAALSIAEVTKRPILFASSGEKVDEFDYFYPERMASRILGMGDLQTLTEQAKRAIDPKAAAKLEEKFASGESFTLEDFLTQIQAMKQMGSISKIIGMLPGAKNPALRGRLDEIDDDELIRTQAIIHSMTPTERRNPRVLNGSRRSRIARGSGRTVTEVNQLVDRFAAAQKVMRQMQSGGGAIPGLALPPGVGAPNRKVQPVAKKKSRSGNPAKRAAAEGGV